MRTTFPKPFERGVEEGYARAESIGRVGPRLKLKVTDRRARSEGNAERRKVGSGGLWDAAISLHRGEARNAVRLRPTSKHLAEIAPTLRSDGGRFERGSGRCEGGQRAGGRAVSEFPVGSSPPCESLAFFGEGTRRNTGGGLRFLGECAHSSARSRGRCHWCARLGCGLYPVEDRTYYATVGRVSRTSLFASSGIESRDGAAERKERQLGGKRGDVEDRDDDDEREARSIEAALSRNEIESSIDLLQF
ncbi:hypothetical protein KM043_007311 [Ampulex compressa]|nr:hypothetical protein KM043_007311 [Ampulex compressa]